MSTEMALSDFGMDPMPLRRLTKRQKAAVIVRLLLAEGIELKLADLPEELQTELAQQMSSMRFIDRVTLKSVVDEFVEEIESVGLSFPGGLEGALNVLDGTVIGQCLKRHRRQEFIRFLNRIDRQTLPGLDIHLIVDNYATHKTPDVKAWLHKHPRFKLHFTPTSASWLNLVERFFAEITSKRIRRASYSGVDDLEAAIYDYLLQHNASPKPFTWSKIAEDILTRERRALDTLDEIRGNR